MLFFRSIIKLQVNIAKGETIVNYDDQTTRRIHHRNCGFVFKCKSNSPATPETMLVTSQTASQTNSLSKIDSANNLEKCSSTLSKIVERKINVDANVASEKSTIVLINNHSKFSLRGSSDTESTDSETAIKLEVKPLDAENALEKLFNLSELDATVVQYFSNELCGPGGAAPFKQPLIGTEPTKRVALIMAIMPELISTDVQENEDEENDGHLVEHASYFFLPNHLVSWHLSTCALKHCKGVPICNCLKIKEKITELRETLQIFIGPGSPAGPMVERRHFINKFLQSFDSIKFLLQALCELLVYHIFFNTQSTNVHCRSELVENQPMIN